MSQITITKEMIEDCLDRSIDDNDWDRYCKGLEATWGDMVMDFADGYETYERLQRERTGV